MDKTSRTYSSLILERTQSSSTIAERKGIWMYRCRCLHGRVCNHLQAVIAFVENHRRCRLLHTREILSENWVIPKTCKHSVNITQFPHVKWLVCKYLTFDILSDFVIQSRKKCNIFHDLLLPNFGDFISCCFMSRLKPDPWLKKLEFDPDPWKCNRSSSLHSWQTGLKNAFKLDF